MKRGSLILIGLLSTIIIIVSLNYAFGRLWFYSNRYPFHRYYHNCNDQNNDGYHNNNHLHQKQSTRDSSISNY